jgi:SOS-response transcriptional repressor LexA
MEGGLMKGQSNRYQDTAEEILTALLEMVQPDVGILEQAPQALYEKARNLCENQCFDEAITCCETARRLAHQTRDSRDRASFQYTEGFSLTHLGTTYLHRGKVLTAIECFQQAATQFRNSNRHRSESVALMAVGEGYVLLVDGKKKEQESVSTHDWVLALGAFQKCLNVLESLRATDQATIRLKEHIVERLETVRQSFTESLERAHKSPDAARPSNDRDQVYRVPIVESIAAGVGLSAEDDTRGGYLWLSRERVRDAKFAVRVEGNSMDGDGIFDGDFVAIQEQPVEDYPGAIAAVLIYTEGQTLGVLKHYYRESDHHRLEPKNEAEPTLIVAPDEKDIAQIERTYRHLDAHILIYPGHCQIVGKPVALFREMG